MIKHKILSSLELLNISKPRLTVVLKEVIDDLLQISSNSNYENLRDFDNLCTQLRNKHIDDISSFLSQNIVDYSINLNPCSDKTFVNIKFIFSSSFPMNELCIKNLKI